MNNIGLNGVLWIFWPPYQSNPVINVCLFLEAQSLFNALSITQAISFIPPKKKNSSSFSAQMSHVSSKSKSINVQSKVTEVTDATDEI
eukprot:CAMPEP_0168538410 /NCGR_PEP_ID=MMETSP0405-20121227/21075_1 /TAXON_ID=498012 /ORGANISM="Trichosphaerium sp, Strain Am-I-7 wt" /LENGTH=87 /DNA_ID=CAMNT_0008567495 /DNA_START=702 /DNA_END=962 /DNA_ORIENTATION=-